MVIRIKMQGLSLIELMVSITVALILSSVVLYFYTAQSATFQQSAFKERTTEEARGGFDLLNHLLRHAEICPVCTPASNVTISYAPSGAANGTLVPEISNDNVQIDIILPSGYSVWPNTVSPYTNNFIRIAWSNSGANANQILVSAAATAVTLAAAVPVVLAGSNDVNGRNTRIVNLDLWPLKADGTAQAAATDAALGGYQLRLTARVGPRDSSYTNALDPSGPLKNYRVALFQSTVYPRNQ